jgi:hypothetical protein
MKPSKTKMILPMVAAILCLAPFGWAGNKKMMAIMAAKNTARRNLVESVYGMKLRSTEEVQDMVAESYTGKTESKTSARITGIKIDDVVYDEEKGIAKATASIALDRITNIDDAQVDLNGKVFRRVGFGAGEASKAGPLRALRAAEIDAYKQLIQNVVGFTLESETSVENFLLASDTIKTKVMATLSLFEISDYGWEDNGDAFVKMTLNIGEASAMLGDKEGAAKSEIIEVIGNGAQEDDFKQADAAN